MTLQTPQTSLNRHHAIASVLRIVAPAALALAIGLCAAALSHAAAIPLSVSERLPLVQKRASFLRQSLCNGRLQPERIEADYAEALQKAEKYWNAGQADEALLALSLLQKYAPIAELPFIKAQLLMAAMADDQRNAELRNHHRAFATALVQAISASGNGLGTATALKLVLPSEAEGWLIAQRDRYQPLGKTEPALQVGAKRYDRWQVRQTDGAERTLYFEVPVLSRTPTAPASTPASRAK